MDSPQFSYLGKGGNDGASIFTVLLKALNALIEVSSRYNLHNFFFWIACMIVLKQEIGVQAEWDGFIVMKLDL